MRRITLISLAAAAAFISTFSWALGPPVSSMNGGNKHNLSSDNTGPGVTYKADIAGSDYRKDQVCVYCHTPHNAGKTALWHRNDYGRTFGHYSSTSLVIDNPSVKATSDYREPTGSSRLCLSCHDGLTALGDVTTGSAIEFPVGFDTIGGLAKFDATKVKSGHHPVSFIYNAGVLGALATKGIGTYKLPTDASVPAGVKAKVRLDRSQRMQCTTCHDPHQNQSDDAAEIVPGRKLVPFWTYGGGGNAVADHDAVCNACHDFTNDPWP